MSIRCIKNTRSHGRRKNVLTPVPHKILPVLQTENLKEQVDAVFAKFPHIGRYIRGCDRSALVSAESLVACYVLECVSWLGPIPCSVRSLDRREAHLRKHLRSIKTKDSKDHCALVISLLLDAFSKAGVK